MIDKKTIQHSRLLAYPESTNLAHDIDMIQYRQTQECGKFQNFTGHNTD